MIGIAGEELFIGSFVCRKEDGKIYNYKKERNVENFKLIKLETKDHNVIRKENLAGHYRLEYLGLDNAEFTQVIGENSFKIKIKDIKGAIRKGKRLTIRTKNRTSYYFEELKSFNDRRYI